MKPTPTTQSRPLPPPQGPRQLPHQHWLPSSPPGPREKQDNPPRSLCDLPNKPPGKTPSLLARQEPASTPARPGNYPARVTRGHSSSTGPASVLLSSPDSRTGCAPTCLALLSTVPPESSSHTPLARTLWPTSHPSQTQEGPKSSPRSLGDDSLSFRFRLTQPGPLDINTGPTLSSLKTRASSRLKDPPATQAAT